ncbi:MAG: Spo0B domain-containing protein [Candidatus Izimaplasma sp.]|nr:Spo0B domain-containing protein [Candidatus Izimaplasma bacterium]
MMKITQSHKLLIFIGLILTTIYILVATVFIATEFQYVHDSTERHVETVAKIYAKDEEVIRGLLQNEMDLEQYLYPLFQVSNQLSYFVIYNTNEQIVGHSDSSQIGESLECIEARAVFEGEEILCESSLFSKEDLQSFVPIYNGQSIIGIMSIGVSADDLWDQKIHQIERIVVIFFVGILSSWGGLWYFSKKYQHRLLGYQPNEIALLYSENKSLIDQLEQAVITVDINYKITTINPMGMHMFGLTKEDIGKDIKGVFPYVALKDIIQNRSHVEDEYIKIKQHKLIMNVYTLYQGSNVIGATVIFRSYLEVDTLINQIKGYRQIASALRSQKHEFQNKLHVILGLIKMGDHEKAENYITENVYKTNLASDYYSSRIKDDRVLALFIGKEIQCTENNIQLMLTSDSFLDKEHTPITSDDVILVLGNLIDNSCDAYTESEKVDKKIVVDIIEDEEQLMIAVIDQAGGIDPTVREHIFERGITTKMGDSRGTGLALVNEIIRLHDGEKTIESSSEETKIEIKLMKVKI